MLVLQWEIVLTDCHLEVRSPTGATPGLINMTLYLGFRLEHRDDLGMGIHQFILRKNKDDFQKTLKSQDDHNQFVSGVDGVPYLLGHLT